MPLEKPNRFVPKKKKEKKEEKSQLEFLLWNLHSQEIKNTILLFGHFNRYAVIKHNKYDLNHYDEIKASHSVLTDLEEIANAPLS